MKKYFLYAFTAYFALLSNACSDDKKGGEAPPPPTEVTADFTAGNAAGTYKNRIEDTFLANFAIDLFNTEGTVREGIILDGITEMSLDPSRFAPTAWQYSISAEVKDLALRAGEVANDDIAGSYYYKKNGELFDHKVLIEAGQVTLAISGDQYTVTGTLTGHDLVTDLPATEIKIAYTGTIAFADNSTPISYEAMPDGFLYYKGEDGNPGQGRVTMVFMNSGTETTYHGLQVEAFITPPADWYNVQPDEGTYAIAKNKVILGMTPGSVVQEGLVKKLYGTFGFESVVMGGTRNVTTADDGRLTLEKTGDGYTINALMTGVNYETGEREEIAVSFTGDLKIENETPAPPKTVNITFTEAEAYSHGSGNMELTLTCKEEGLIKVMNIDMFMDSDDDSALVDGDYVVDDGSEDPGTLYPGEIYDRMVYPTCYWEEKDDGDDDYDYVCRVPMLEDAGKLTIKGLGGDNYSLTMEFTGIEEDTKGEFTVKGTFNGKVEFDVSPWSFAASSKNKIEKRTQVLKMRQASAPKIRLKTRANEVTQLTN